MKCYSYCHSRSITRKMRKSQSFHKTLNLWRSNRETENHQNTDTSHVTPYHRKFIQNLSLIKSPWQNEHQQHIQLWNKNEIKWRVTEKEYWWIQIQSINIHKEGSLSSKFKQLYFFLWPTFILYNQMNTSQVTRFLFPCITIHRTYLIYDPIRR